MKKKKKFIKLTCEPQNSLSKTTFSLKICLRLTQVKITKKKFVNSIYNSKKKKKNTKKKNTIFLKKYLRHYFKQFIKLSFSFPSNQIHAFNLNLGF